MKSIKLRGVVTGLLASTAFAPRHRAGRPDTERCNARDPDHSVARAGHQCHQRTGETRRADRNDGEVADETEIVITAQKREENLQDVRSGAGDRNRRLTAQHLNFEDYTSSFRRSASRPPRWFHNGLHARCGNRRDGNHTALTVVVLPRRAAVTTIGGTLDVHIRYRPDREYRRSAGPLYGASSQAGTIRIITKSRVGVLTAASTAS